MLHFCGKKPIQKTLHQIVYPNYEPTTTSYDYDALLTESGDITEKYLAVRETIARCTGRALSQLPPVPIVRCRVERSMAVGSVRASGGMRCGGGDFRRAQKM